jgi:alkylhydroperoxidase family enzyme
MHDDDLRSLAPDAFSAFDTLHATVAQVVPPGLVAMARAAVEAARGGRAADVPAPREVTRFAEQFVLDVSGVTDEQRAAATAQLGADAFEFVQLLYVFDWTARLGPAFDACFGTAGVPRTAATPAASLWAACEAMFAAVARLRAVDPLTTEIVRLRGARAHDCRLCKSLRNVQPASDGVDETLYDQIDHYATSDLSERHQVALRCTDALIWPAHAFPEDVAHALRAHFTDAQVVELLFDVARNAANKIAVAFGADAPHVVEGVEYFDTDERGELHYGLTPAPSAPSAP